MPDVLRWSDPLPALDRPVLLLALRGWFDTSGVATEALSTLTSSTGSTRLITSIDPDPFYDFTQTRPTIRMPKGGRRQPVIEWPENEFVAVALEGRVAGAAGRDVVVLNGYEPHVRWRTFNEAVLAVVRAIDAALVVTLGAIPDSAPHTRRPAVTGSTPDPELARRLGLSVPSYQGITGAIGTLQELLEREGVPAISLRVGVPHYLVNAEHPVATVALLAHLEHVLGARIDATALTATIDEWREAHDAAVEADPSTAAYVRMLEVDWDRRTEAAIPSADALGAELERYLREHGPHAGDGNEDDAGDGEDEGGT